MVERHPIRNREQWLAMRAGDLTASDIGAAIGLSRFKSRLQLWAEKTGRAPDRPDNEAMQRGRWMEAAVLSAIREVKGWDNVVQPRVYLRDPELRLGATPDALHLHPSGPPTNIQCKVVSRPVYERDWAAGPPLEYLLQTVTEGLLLGAADSYLAALVISTHTAQLKMHPVPRHPAAEAKVQAIARGFWADIEAGIRPPADYSRDADTVAALYPQSEPEPVLDLSGDNRLPELLIERARIKELVSDGEGDLKAIDTEIKAKLGAHEKATLPGWKISWKSQTVAEHVVKEHVKRPLLVTDLRESEEEEAA